MDFYTDTILIWRGTQNLLLIIHENYDRIRIDNLFGQSVWNFFWGISSLKKEKHMLNLILPGGS